MIKLLRIDERLIHGQVAYAWTTQYKSQALMVITMDEKNSLEKMSLELACPRNLKCFICTVPDAVGILNKYENKDFFVVTDTPETVIALLDADIAIKNINVGGLYHKEGRESVTKTVFLDDSLKNMFKTLHERGVDLDIRATPSDKSVDLSKLI
ncbi:PTS sugar transporter subunit IIB [Erysipelothrix aquatica]|uniref:PTS sugar transporter subunit IIB n=1 Tax=Erysipelothrix aquatica TaxID=2683714 RepID=UPI00135C0380|nr:PTS sugar transporter subunit IIB [Erysipelothrix aquatica]